MSRKLHVLKWLLYAVLFLPFTEVSANAVEIDKADFSLRFPSALSRFSSYADVAASGGASAGSKWQSSVNPASSAWQGIQTQYHLSLSPQYSSILFREDTILHVTTESITWDVQNWGTFQPTLAQVQSNEKTTRQGLGFNYEMDYFQLQWGKHINQDLALGINFNYASSEVLFKIDSLDVTKSEGEGYDFRFGLLYKAIDKLLLGLVLDYGFSPSTTTLYDLSGFGLGDVKLKDTTIQYIVRPGLSYEYKKDSSIYFDYQFGSFSNDTGNLKVHRFYTGVDHQLLKWLFVRGGLAFDTDENSSWTCGLGIYPSKHLSIDIGYQYDMFPELQKEFGRSHLMTISTSINF